MFGLSMGHLIVLFVVVLLFGSKRLPELGNALGKGIRAFKSGLEGQPTPDEIAQSRLRWEQEQQANRKTDTPNSTPSA